MPIHYESNCGIGSLISPMLQFYVIPNRLENKNENYVAGIFLQGSKKVTKAPSL